MSINQKSQCKSSYQHYLQSTSLRLLSRLSPEAKQQLAEQIQARVVLNGVQSVNQAFYQNIISKLKGVTE